MKIALILLAIACLGELLGLFLLNRAIDAIFNMIAETAKNEAEYRDGAAKELSKVHQFASDNADAVKKLRRRVTEIGDGTKNMAKDAAAFELKVDKRFNYVKEQMQEIKKAQEAYDNLADESVRAQIESEKAWAEGVRAIANFGASIPSLNTKGLENE
jgi:hypothetical protein